MSGVGNGRRAHDAVTVASFTAAPRPRQAMIAVRLDGDGDEASYLWCDPLTGLVAYPSFAEHLTARLPGLVSSRLHLAIGDVDDLKQYVSQRRADDPTCFGHLAGNECMRILGQVTRLWTDRTLSSWPFALCGTFGGDEVIIAVAGKDFADFVADLRLLMRAIDESVPRTCSFAAGTLASDRITAEDGDRAYRQFVSRVDEALFARKAMLREANVDPRGAFVEVGTVLFARSEAHP